MPAILPAIVIGVAGLVLTVICYAAAYVVDRHERRDTTRSER
ncbi:hypothetical protein [Nocardia sp. R7R-8]